MTDLTKKMIETIKEKYTGITAIIGISGGKDSTCAAALFAQALGSDNVVGVMMPDGEQKDILDSELVVFSTGIKSFNLNIGSITKAIKDRLSETGKDLNNNTTFNIPPRVRMTMLYAVASLFPNGRVINTSNASEAYIGWTTKWGDNVGDIYPFINLSKETVVKIALDLGVHPSLALKEPADGLTGKTDEDNIGFTYAQLHTYMLSEKDSNATPPELPEDIKAKIAERHKISEHKRAGAVPLIDLP